VDSTIQRIRRLEEDLQAIKSVLDRNKSIVREMLLRTGTLKFLMGFVGASCTLICFSYYAALRVYGGLERVPPAFNWVFGTAIVIAMAVTSILKLVIFFRQIEKLKIEARSALLIMLLKSPLIVHLFYPIVALIAILSVFLISRGLAPYCVAVWGIGLGILWNAVGAGFSLVEYIVLGWWMMATGVLSMVFPGVHPLIWTGVVFGIGFSWVTVYLAIAERRTGRRQPDA
jgi:hypothetical protein